MDEERLRERVLLLAGEAGWPRISWSTAAVIAPLPGGEQAWQRTVTQTTGLGLRDLQRLLEKRLATRGTLMPAVGISGAAPGAPGARVAPSYVPTQPASSGPAPLPAEVVPPHPGAGPSPPDRWQGLIQASRKPPSGSISVLQEWSSSKDAQAQQARARAAENLARRTEQDALASGDPAAFRLLASGAGSGPLAKAQRASKERVRASLDQARRYLNEADHEAQARAEEAQRLYTQTHRQR